MSLEQFYHIFYIQTALAAFVAVVSFFFIKTRSFNVKMIGLLFTLSFIFNVLGYFLRSNLAGNVYDFSLFILVTTLFNYNTNKKYSGAFALTAVLFLVFALYNLVFLQREGIASYNKLIASFLILSYCLIYFYRLIIELPTTNVLKLPMFWFASAFLFFHAGTFILFVFTDYLVNVLQNDLVTYWSFHNILSIIQQVIILVGLHHERENVNIKIGQ